MEVLGDGRRAIGSLGIDQWQLGYPERSLIESDVKRGVSYVALDDEGAIAGTMVLDFEGEPTYDQIDGSWLADSTSSSPDYGVIHRMAVADDHRNQGVARFMFDQAKVLADERGVTSLRVDTHPGNIPMNNLIKSCGYTYCGVILIGHAGEASPERLAYELLL